MLPSVSSFQPKVFLNSDCPKPQDLIGPYFSAALFGSRSHSWTAFLMLPLFISVQLSSFLFGCSPRSAGSFTTSHSSTAVVLPRRHSSSSLITPSRSPRSQAALPGVFVAHCSASQPSLRDVMHGSAPRESNSATMSVRWYSLHSEQGC